MRGPPPKPPSPALGSVRVGETGAVLEVSLEAFEGNRDTILEILSPTVARPIAQPESG